MSNHKIALVPLAAGYFQSPELFAVGTKADTGLFAESLIYYDSVYVHVDNPEQFADFIGTLIQQGLSLESLNELIENECLRFFNTVSLHPFMGHVHSSRTIVSGFYAIQEKAMLESNYFATRFLEFEGLQRRLSGLSGFNQSAFDRFLHLASKNATTFSSESIGADIVNNAYEDFLNPDRCRHITRSILEEIYRTHQLGTVPDFGVKIREMDAENYVEIAQNPNSAVINRDSGRGSRKVYEVEFSIPIENLKTLDNGKPLKFFQTLPLSCAGVSNLYIKCAGKLKCDLFLPKPISNIIGDKLYEISDLDGSRNDIKVDNVIQNLKAKVEFPDLRRLVNTAQVDFAKVLEIRTKAKPFREWLQTEAERDGDAIVAYHSEVAKETGFTRINQTSLKLFGVLALLSVYSKIQFKDDAAMNSPRRYSDDDPIKNLFDYGAGRLGEDWKPVCFGDWYKGDIATVLRAPKSKST